MINQKDTVFITLNDFLWHVNPCYNLDGDNMALDGYFINKLIEEVKPVIINSRIEKIFQTDKDIFIFSLYKRGQRNYLYFKLNAPSASFYVLDKLVSVENTSSNFLINLKNNIDGYLIEDINQLKKDRVITFNLVGNDFLDGRVNKSLVTELMGRYNNLILLDNENIIIDAFNKKFDSNARSILPKLKYEYFPTNKVDFINEYPLLETNLDLSKKYLGISPLLSKYLFNNQLNLDNIKVYPVKNTNNNQFYWFNLFNKEDELKTYSNLSNLLADSIIVMNHNNNKYLNFINSQLNKETKLLENLKKSLEQSNNNLTLKDIGDSIYITGLDLSKSYSSFTNYLGEEIKLDPSKTLNQNAQNYYRLYQKAKRSIEHINTQITNVSNNINLLEQLHFDLSKNDVDYLELEEILVPLGLKVKKQKQTRKKKKNINPLIINYNDAIFYVGKNNLQNEYVTHEIGKHNDFWFHIKDAPGSHIVLKGELNDLNLSFGAMLAAKFSKQSDTPVVSVNFTQIKNIKIIPGLKGYNVILTKFETINIRIDHELLSNYLLHTIWIKNENTLL